MIDAVSSLTKPILCVPFRRVGRAGGLGGTLKTGRTLNYVEAGDDNRKMSSLYLSIMDRMGVKLDQFGDSDTRLERL